MSMNFRQINFILNPTAAQVSSNHLRYLYCLILLMVLITRPPCEISPLSTTRCYIHVDILEPDTAFHDLTRYSTFFLRYTTKGSLKSRIKSPNENWLPFRTFHKILKSKTVLFSVLLQSSNRMFFSKTLQLSIQRMIILSYILISQWRSTTNYLRTLHVLSKCLRKL